MNKADYDLIIIGGGPAGLTAGMYASRARLNTLLVERTALGGQMLVTDWMENYPGFPEGLTGIDLVQKMRDQALKFGLSTKDGHVSSLELSAPLKTVHFKNEAIRAHTVIIATGATPRRLGIPGEAKFFGKGISTCATCDAPFYKDRVVVAAGGGDTAVQESLYLAKFARKVFLVHRRDRLRATKILQERAFDNDRIEIIWDSVLTGVNGFFNVESVTLENVKTGQARTIAAEGCFIWIGTIPKTDFLNGSVQMDPGGYIITDAAMQTSVPGVYAAGDVRVTPLRQVATAVGDGAMAATSAGHYIENINAGAAA